MLAAFSGLSERDREVLALVAWEGLDVERAPPGRSMASFAAANARRAGTAPAPAKPSELDGIDAFDWYVDPVSGRPLGAIERIGEQIRTERLERYEQLDPTATALAALNP